MNIHCFQHVPFEGLGSIEEWILQAGHILTITKLYDNNKIPSVEDIDWLIVMGGPMSVYDADKFPWLKQEKAFIHQAIEKGKTVIGICLGAQLIADVLGARIYPNPEKEIGWFPIRFTENAKQFPAFIHAKPDYTVFHWHGDTFDLPKGSDHLAFSQACKNQAFVYKKKVLGLQFHLETTEESLLQMVKYGDKELIPDNFIQSASTIIAQQSFMSDNKNMLFTLLNETAHLK